ncbi:MULTISPECIES: helix-turn-helix domain-containing protein [Kitasatospora]|uniref:Transposase n=1 Tax=Kitasatospora cystarginea TaxID=58350 RepID=A0ABN3EKL1_9ACTN
MPVATARPIVLTAAERHRRKKAAYGHRTEHRDRVRARIVLLAARSRSNARIAVEAGVHVVTVRIWRGRFADLGLRGPLDRQRTGRPPVFTPLQAVQVKALACRLPAETGAPLSRWSCPELARAAMSRGIAASVSASTVRRWLDQDAIKPWQHRSWIFITDPDFHPKAARVLDLYARSCDGEPIGADEYVIGADKKTNDFTSLTQVKDRLRDLEDRYNATAQPFQWRFTTSDLDDLLARLDRHTTDHQEESSAAQPA